MIDGRQALLVSKRLDRREAEIFTVPIDPPAPLVRPALPERVGTLPEFVEPATGASLSPDGNQLAVCSLDVARVYDRAPDKSWRLLTTLRYEPDEIEAIAWDGRDLILASEHRNVYRIAEAEWLRHLRTRPPARP